MKKIHEFKIVTIYEGSKEKNERELFALLGNDWKVITSNTDRFGNINYLLEYSVLKT